MNKGVEIMIKKRKELGLTQKELSNNLKIITRNGIALIETERSKPSIKTAKAIGKYLDFDWTMFFDSYENIDFTDEEKEDFFEQEKVSELIIKMIKRRTELNLTQNDLAKKSGIKQSIIAKLEKMNYIPRLDMLIKLLSALDLNLIVEA